MSVETKKKEKLSATQVNMFLNCGAQWMFRYVEGIKTPPAMALTFGTAVDKGLEHNFKQKITSGQDETPDTVADVFVDTFDREIKNTVLAEDDDPAASREQGVGLVRKYMQEEAPPLQPKEGGVQEFIDLPLGEAFPYDYTTKLDLTTVDDLLIDHKTANKSPSRRCPKCGKTGQGDRFDCKECGSELKVESDISNVGHQHQLISYSLAHEHRWGRPPKQVRIDYLIKTKEPKIMKGTMTVDDEDKRFWMNTVARVADGIQKEVFIPNRGSMMCSKRWCGYWRQCEANWGGKVKP